jgi:predicted nucleic acid-binding protein
MNYLLDTVTLSDLYEPNSPGHPSIVSKLAALGGEDAIFISVLSLYELEYGFANAPEDKKAVIRQRITDAQSDFKVLSLSSQAASMFGALKKSLRVSRSLTERGSRYHNIDLMIAATAILESCTLVSADSLYPHLQELDTNLRLENWGHP